MLLNYSDKGNDHPAGITRLSIQPGSRAILEWRSISDQWILSGISRLGALELAAQVERNRPVVDCRKEIPRCLQVLLPQGLEGAQELRRSIPEVRQILIAACKYNPVVAWKATPAFSTVGFPFLASGKYVLFGAVVAASKRP